MATLAAGQVKPVTADNPVTRENRKTGADSGHRNLTCGRCWAIIALRNPTDEILSYKPGMV